MAQFESFITTMKNIETRMENRVSKNSEDTIKQNRKFLSSVIRAIEYCGWQVIGLRGHRDDGSIFDNDDSNQGNFRELLKLMAEIDNNLDIRLRTCAWNATYTSNTMQNELLSCIKDYIQSQVVADINNQIRGPYYEISADEVTDCSNWEQLGIVLRSICKRFSGSWKVNRVCQVP